MTDGARRQLCILSKMSRSAARCKAIRAAIESDVVSQLIGRVSYPDLSISSQTKDGRRIGSRNRAPDRAEPIQVVDGYGSRKDAAGICADSSMACKASRCAVTSPNR